MLPGDVFGRLSWSRDVAGVSGQTRALLSVLQHTGQHLAAEGCLARDVTGAGVRNPGLNKAVSLLLIYWQRSFLMIQVASEGYYEIPSNVRLPHRLMAATRVNPAALHVLSVTS